MLIRMLMLLLMSPWVTFYNYDEIPYMEAFVPDESVGEPMF